MLILLFYLSFIIRSFQTLAKKEERFFTEQDEARNSLKYFADADSIYFIVERGSKDYEELLVKFPLLLYDKPVIPKIGGEYFGKQAFYYLPDPNQKVNVPSAYSILDSIKLDNHLIYIKKMN